MSKMSGSGVQNVLCCSAVRLGRGFKSSLSERGRNTGTFCTWKSKMVVKIERRCAYKVSKPRKCHADVMSKMCGYSVHNGRVQDEVDPNV